MALTRPRASQLNTNTIDFSDPLVRINKGQSGANDKDIGIVLERGTDTNVAFIWDESADQFAVINTNETGSTAGDVTISSYANIKANAFYGDGSNLTGIASAYGDSDVAAYLSANGYGTSGSIIASITDSAPTTLDTLNELAAALGDDPNFATTVTNSIAAKAPLASPALTGIATVAGTVEISPSTSYDPTGGGSGTDTATDVAIAFPSGNRIVGTNDGYIRTIIEWNSSSDIEIGQTSTSLISGINLLPGSSGDAKVNGDRILTTADEGSGNGLDADTLDGMQPVSTNTASTVVSRDASGDFSAGTITATATNAQYADLAENYLADQAYPVGTVLEIGGDAEVTIAVQDSYKVVGTISEAPGYLMNSGLEGEHVVPVAYIGRVPCRVQGTVNRGDFLVVGDTPGVAVAKHPMNILMGTAIGKALEDYNSNEEGVIEILVGRL